MNILNEIILDLNKFKITFSYKEDKDPLIISFNKSPSRNFYCCVVALVLVEMKKKGKVSYVNIDDHVKSQAANFRSSALRPSVAARY